MKKKFLAATMSLALAAGVLSVSSPRAQAEPISALAAPAVVLGAIGTGIVLVIPYLLTAATLAIRGAVLGLIISLSYNTLADYGLVQRLREEEIPSFIH
ncbi:MAG: hypothetical protein Q3962_04835 [Corynebacterium sp.]|nr:hypothetical protein [Corynebacterium sp.]